MSCPQKQHLLTKKKEAKKKSYNNNNMFVYSFKKSTLFRHGHTTHHSPLTTHHSPLTTHHSPPTTHYSPLTTHHSLLTTLLQRLWQRHRKSSPLVWFRFYLDMPF